MGEFAGFEMPLQYSSIKEEVIAVRESLGVFDVSHMGQFFVEGTDAVDFVDYLLPNDFKGAGNLKAVSHLYVVTMELLLMTLSLIS